MKVRLGDLTRIKTGKLDANASSPDGVYPFFTCSKEPLRIDSYSYDCECVLVAGNGDLNVKYYHGKFDAYQRTYIIESNGNGKLFMPYLYYFMDGYLDKLRKMSIGGVIKYIKLGNLTDALIELPDYETQKQVVRVLNKVEEVITARQQELQKLDELVKARFVEMFGDPEFNTFGWDTEELGTLCDVGSSKRIYQNEQSQEGVPFWRISDLISKMDIGVADSGLFIPEERYVELKNAGLVPTTGDILVTSRGTLGRCYIIKDEDKFYFQDGMISWLSSYVDGITPLYLQYLFTMPGFRKQIDGMQAGSTVAYLSIAMLKKLRVMVPPIETQNCFALFVEQLDKSKVVVQKALDEAQMLFDSLMQEYFG